MHSDLGKREAVSGSPLLLLQTWIVRVLFYGWDCILVDWLEET